MESVPSVNEYLPEVSVKVLSTGAKLVSARFSFSRYTYEFFRAAPPDCEILPLSVLRTVTVMLLELAEQPDELLIFT